MTRNAAIWLTRCLACLLPLGQAHSAGAQASGSGNIELGATQPSRIEMNAGASGRGAGRRSDVRLGLQLRVDAINTLSTAQPGGGLGAPLADLGRGLLVPIATPGVRILDEALFLGLGLGFVGVSQEAVNGDETSRSGFSLTPLAGYDILTDDSVALALLGWLNVASLGETENCDASSGACAESNDDAFGWGLSLGAGLRGFLLPGLALGGELGWGFLSVDYDIGGGAFVHGIFGNLFLEASLGL